jgi:hypothetical protein
MRDRLEGFAQVGITRRVGRRSNFTQVIKVQDGQRVHYYLELTLTTGSYFS